jgi:hypothetical protein
MAEGRRRARNTYVCFRCEHPIPQGTDYVIEVLDAFNEPFASFRAAMKSHPQGVDGCECAECQAPFVQLPAAGDRDQN